MRGVIHPPQFRETQRQICRCSTAASGEEEPGAALRAVSDAERREVSASPIASFDKVMAVRFFPGGSFIGVRSGEIPRVAWAMANACDIAAGDVLLENSGTCDLGFIWVIAPVFAEV